MPSFQRYLYLLFVEIQLIVFCTSFSEEDTAVIKTSLLFLKVTLNAVATKDEEFIYSIIQLILFVLSKQSFSQNVLDVVATKLVSLLEKFSEGILKLKTLRKSSLQMEIKVQDI